MTSKPDKGVVACQPDCDMLRRTWCKVVVMTKSKLKIECHATKHDRRLWNARWLSPPPLTPTPFTLLTHVLQLPNLTRMLHKLLCLHFLTI